PLPAVGSPSPPRSTFTHHDAIPLACSFSARSAAVRSRDDSIRNSFPEVVAAHTAAISAPMAPSADAHSARIPNVLSFPHPVKHHVRVGTIPRTNNREFNVG